MLERPALAVSLPASELTKARLPGSVFGARDLVSTPLSGELRQAIALIEGVCAQSGFAPAFVARPEIFTHGESLAWLTRKLAGVRDHLAFSDGSTVRVIPGLRNHVFFYGQSRREDGEALERLERRAGELLAGLASQINSALKFGRGRAATSPETIALIGRNRALYDEPEFYRFYFNPHAIESCVERIVAAGPLGVRETRFESLDYVALTEASLADAPFCAELARRAAPLFFQPARGMALRLPVSAGGSDRLGDRLAAALNGFARAQIAMPHVPVDNLVFVSGDLAPGQWGEMAAEVDFLAHDTFEFWSAAPASYRHFRALRVALRRARHAGAANEALLTALCGRAPEFIRPAPIRPGARA